MFELKPDHIWICHLFVLGREKMRKDSRVTLVYDLDKSTVYERKDRNKVCMALILVIGMLSIALIIVTVIKYTWIKIFIELGSCSLWNRNNSQCKRISKLRCSFYLVFCLVVVHFITLKIIKRLYRSYRILPIARFLSNKRISDPLLICLLSTRISLSFWRQQD